MKIIVNQNNLKRALNLVEKVVSRNPSLPVLNNILLKTENGRLKLVATNLELGVNYVIGAKIEEVGEIAVPAKIFSDFVNNVMDEKIVLITKNNILSINSDSYKTQILGLDPKDFPIIPKIRDDLVCNIPASMFKKALISVLDSVALSETRPEIAGAFCKIEEKRITLASTDSFRLTEKIIENKNNRNTDFILPRNTVAELIRVLSDLEGDIKIYVKENQASFLNNDFELVTRLVDGNYPDYKKVIPDKFISKILVSRENLEKNVKLAGLFSSNISDIKISCTENKMQIISKNSNKGEIEVYNEAFLKNEPFEISLNYQYLLDGLKALNEDKVVIEFTGQGSPLLLRPANDKKDAVYIIMPFRK